MRTLVCTGLAVLMITLLSACDEDFGVINTNPNSPEEAFPELILPNLITTTANQMAETGWYNGNLVMQLTAKNNFTGFDRYQWGSNEDLWHTMYRVMRDAQTLRELGEEVGNPNYQGIALIFRSFAAAMLTDAFGDVPYSEAVRGKSDGIFTPKYDPQETIYDGILADLEQANQLLDPAGPAIDGDPLYGGDVLKWKKLANSLRLRYLLRISNRRNVGAAMQAIVDAGPIFESNADHAALRYLASAPNQFFMHTARVGSFDEVRMSKTIELVLKATDDPRMYVWFREVDNPDSAGVYRGMPNGLSEGAAYDYNGGSQANVSRLGRMFREEPDGAHGILMSYSELQFILAEAAHRGLIAGDAEAYYLEGIRASMAFYGVDPGEAFYTQERVVFDPSRGLEQIMEQKWLASFMVGFEAWNDWRRTGLPPIEPAVDNVNGDRIPVRFEYPGDEQSLNAKNYQEAVGRQGDDTINTRFWWAK